MVSWTSNYFSITKVIPVGVYCPLLAVRVAAGEYFGKFPDRGRKGPNVENPRFRGIFSVSAATLLAVVDVCFVVVFNLWQQSQII